MQLEASGHPLHTRALTIETEVLDDGRWRFRGDVNDLRKCSFVPMIDDIQPAGIIHQMAILGVLDPETRVIHDIRVEQPHVAVEPSALTGGECCRDPGPKLVALSGETLDDGFHKRLSAHFGGALGCSHLLTLFQMMADALPAALDWEERARAEDGATRDVGERPFRRGAFVDGYEAPDEGGIQLVAQLGDFYTKPNSAGLSPIARVAHQHDVRIQVTVESGTRRLRDLRVAERDRDSETLRSAPWHDRLPELEGFEGAPIMPGMAKRVLTTFGDDSGRLELRDLLLQLAPGFIQVLAAISERFYVQPKSPSGEKTGGAKTGDVEMMGGMIDSCWMWRSGGALTKRRQQAEAASGRKSPTL